MIDVVQDAVVIRNVTRKVYWNSRFYALRNSITEEDLIQMVYLKLLQRDNCARYSEEYSLVSFLYRVANGCAINYSKKSMVQKESTVLDDDEPNQFITVPSAKSLTDDPTLRDLMKSLEVKERVDAIRQYMSKDIHVSLLLRYNGQDTPFTMLNMFNLFFENRLSRKEMRQCIISKKTDAPVLKITFRKLWESMLLSAQNTLNYYV